MKNIRIFTLIISFGITLSSFGQTPDMQIKKEKNFEKEALYGYINGGSDLFFEYGFNSLNVREVQYKGFDYTIEIYNMGTSKNAFGIYSIHIFKPLKVDYLVGFDCLSKYQLQAAVGSLYYSIVFPVGEKASSGAEEILLYLLSGEKSNNDFLPPLIAELEKPFSGRLKYARGALGLTNIDSEISEIISTINEEVIKTGIWIYTPPTGDIKYFFDADL